MSARQPVELPSHEVLSRLAREDPEAYEAWRREAIESFIDSAPARIKPRLRGIQFRVDNIRRLSRSALGSTVKVYELMWENFVRLNDGWQDLVRAKNECVRLPGSTLTMEYVLKTSAQIIEFRLHPPRDKK